MTKPGRSFSREPLFRGGELLLELVEGAGVTTNAIADAMGVSPAVVRGWIVGAREPSLRQAFALLRRYEVPIEAWLEPSKATRDAA